MQRSLMYKHRRVITPSGRVIKSPVNCHLPVLQSMLLEIKVTLKVGPQGIETINSALRLMARTMREVLAPPQGPRAAHVLR